MLIDTHCHLDDAAFDADRAQTLESAVANGVQAMVMPAVSPANFEQVATLAQQYQPCCYALGMHPMFIDQCTPEDVDKLEVAVTQALKHDQKLVAIGEIGLDYYGTKENKTTQAYFFSEQLKIAKAHDLPVILHVRQAIDDVLKHLRRVSVCGGIAHAFNGSQQQAEILINMGFKLGFGGAMTYPRAAKIRALATTLPLASIVLETDAPDMPPAWLEKGQKNSPTELLKIAETMAALRRIPVSQIIEITGKNSLEILPKLGNLFTRVQVLH